MTESPAMQTRSTGDEMIYVSSFGVEQDSKIYATVPPWMGNQGSEVGRIALEKGSAAADISELDFYIQARLLGRILDWYQHLDHETGEAEMSGVGIEWRERESYETSVDFVSIGRAEFRPVSED